MENHCWVFIDVKQAGICVPIFITWDNLQEINTREKLKIFFDSAFESFWDTYSQIKLSENKTHKDIK